MLAHLDGDRSAALAMFARARQLAALAEGLGAAMPTGGGAQGDAISAAGKAAVNAAGKEEI
jgi:hypothetical protein